MLDNDVALVVDDSSTVRRVVVNILRDYLNCRDIFQAANGTEAINLLGKLPRVDWIFCDWEMPGMTGDQVLMEIRKNPRTANIPFIMITTRSDRDSLVAAVQAGATSYVVKPFNAATLVNKVRAVIGQLERRKAERYKVHGELPVHIELEGHKDQGAELLDISLTGLLCMTPQPFSRQVAVFDQGQVVLGGEPSHFDPLTIQAEIVRLEADPNHPGRTDKIRVALRFQPMEKEARTRLVSLTEQLRAGTTVK